MMLLEKYFLKFHFFNGTFFIKMFVYHVFYGNIHTTIVGGWNYWIERMIIVCLTNLKLQEEMRF